jgi:asparagine synthase (glutamine-hydrolysing)
MLARMAAAIKHRGPDGYGFSLSRNIGLAHLRLAIIDLACGTQPMATDDGALVIAFNGEIYNWPELRRELVAHGHTFRTHSDTEVLLELWRAWGAEGLNKLNGQFAFAVHDRRDGSLSFVRDRFGVRPLYYAETRDGLVFASECKAIFASGLVQAEPDLKGLDEIFTWWAPRGARTVFAGVRQLEPGCWARWEKGRLMVNRWWRPEYHHGTEEPADALEQLDQLLRSSVDFRLRADVPVGAYLSGGLDSTITSLLAAKASPHQLRTFSIAFDDPKLDERAHQEVVARAVGSAHIVEMAGLGDIARVFPEVVMHAELPLVRTAPAPMYLLARRVREQGIKVVLTGEGSDELFLGYDLFKETAVRRFCMRQPGSPVRPRLLDRLYPYLAHDSRGGELWRKFFLEAGAPDDPLFSHSPRIALTQRIKDFYSGDTRASLAGSDVLGEWRASLPAEFTRWSDLERAAYLEVSVLLPSYLLASQGDRMAMAHGVEGRFPFLDQRLFEFASRLPERSRLSGLREKSILRRWAKTRIPAGVVDRAKQPYRAPDAAAFFGPGAPEWVEDVLSPAAVRNAGLFDPAAVEGLVRRCRAGRATGFRENQALVSVLSGQLWHGAFLASRPAVTPLSFDGADIVLDESQGVPAPAMEGQ